jgi:hypothetical protein
MVAISFNFIATHHVGRHLSLATCRRLGYENPKPSTMEINQCLSPYRLSLAFHSRP